MIEVIRTASQMRDFRDALSPTTSLALVPTMGYLHAGHLSLVHEARRRVGPDGRVVVSIFVNPTQFGPNEDLAVYPRDETGDLVQAAAAGADVALCPTDVHEMYPSKATWVNVEGLSDGLCGRTRPDHFRGVCTIVTKLLALVRPDVTVFGEKDYQQLAIVRRLHADLFLPGEIVSMPIVRERDGLALSSRNAYLSPSSREDALSISRFLQTVRERAASGQRAVAALVGDAADHLVGGEIDYVEVVDAKTLEPVAAVSSRPLLVAIAARFGGVRLIDNTVLHP
jgi:pantoate--beta-alanine ligase